MLLSSAISQPTVGRQPVSLNYCMVLYCTYSTVQITGHTLPDPYIYFLRHCWLVQTQAFQQGETLFARASRGTNQKAPSNCKITNPAPLAGGIHLQAFRAVAGKADLLPREYACRVCLLTAQRQRQHYHNHQCCGIKHGEQVRGEAASAPYTVNIASPLKQAVGNWHLIFHD